MKKILFGALTAWLAFALVSCGGGGDSAGDSRQGQQRSSSSGPVSNIVGLIGIVVDSTTGNPIVGVTVTAGTLSTTTDAIGNFAMPTIPNGSNVVSFTLTAYAPQSRTVTISSNIETSLIVQMVPNAASDPFNPTLASALTAGSVAQLNLGAGVLRKSDGTAPDVGTATALLTPIGPSLDAYLLPGEYVVVQTAGGNAQFETYGGLDMRITDFGGNALTGVVGAADIRIPVNTRSTALPATVELMYFDTTTGLWVQDGTAIATLGGTAPNQYYAATITRIATYAVGQVYTVSTITACVVDQTGAPVSGARVQSDGINYSGGGTATTNASGVALVPMKRSGQAIITATSPRSSNSGSISAAQSAADFTLTPCLIMPLAGMTMRLTWGPSPSDLDSHLKGPNGTHVFYITRGSLSAAPFAALDVDDTTSFGPEVISIVRLTRGTSEYFVHNFSNSFAPGMTGSPARIEVRVGSQIRIFFPAAGEAANPYWRVFQFTVASDCSVTITTLNSWAATEPANPAGAGTGTFCN